MGSYSGEKLDHRGEQQKEQQAQDMTAVFRDLTGSKESVYVASL